MSAVQEAPDSGGFGFGFVCGLACIVFILVLAPSDRSQREWDLVRKLETTAKERDDVSLAYINALRRAAVCVDEPVDRREVKPE